MRQLLMKPYFWIALFFAMKQKKGGFPKETAQFFAEINSARSFI